MTLSILYFNGSSETLHDVRYTSVYPHLGAFGTAPMMRVEFFSALEARSFNLDTVQNITVLDK